MIDFTQWLDSFIRASWQGTALIGLVWIILHFSKNSSRVTHSWIWPVAMAKFLLVAFLVWELPILPSISKTARVAPHRITGSSEQIAVIPQILFAIWLGGALFIVIRSAREYMLLKQLARSAKNSSKKIADICEAIAGRTIIVKDHIDVPVPFVFGVFKPMVLLPTDLTNELCDEQLKMLMAHEIAHINRRDTVTAMYVFVCQTLFFFHPAIWLARREWEIAREAACDQFAMHQTNTNRRDYADMLLKVSLGAQRAPAFALSAVPAFRTLHRRINNMKETTTKKKGVARAGWLIALALIGAAALPFAFVQKKPIANQPASLPIDSSISGAVFETLPDEYGVTYEIIAEDGEYEFVELTGDEFAIANSGKVSFEVTEEDTETSVEMMFETLPDENGNTIEFEVDDSVEVILD